MGRQRVPEKWAFVEKHHPGAYAAWLRGPNLDDAQVAVTGPKNRFAVANRKIDGELWSCFYRDREGDAEWHPRSDDDPITTMQRKHSHTITRPAEES